MRIVGRARDLIVLPSGMKVWPQDVEDVLREDAAVKDAAVVAIPAPRGGIRLHAYLLPATETQTADLRRIIAKANARLAPHQRLDRASWWVEPDFPRTTLLKVRRHLLPLSDHSNPGPSASVLATERPGSRPLEPGINTTEGAYGRQHGVHVH